MKMKKRIWELRMSRGLAPVVRMEADMEVDMEGVARLVDCAVLHGPTAN